MGVKKAMFAPPEYCQDHLERVWGWRPTPSSESVCIWGVMGWSWRTVGKGQVLGAF